jgi:HK97 family phage portal protein
MPYTQAPNTLGRFMHYWTSAVAHARSAFDKQDQARRVGLGFVNKLSEGAQSYYTADSAAAELLAITSYAVYSCLLWIGNAVSDETSWPRACLRKGEDLIEVDNHEFEQLLQSPNDQFPYPYLVRYMMQWYALRGNAYLFISTPRIGVGKPEELWPIPANMCTPLPETLRRSPLTGHLVKDFKLTIEGQDFKLPGENVMHMMNPHPWNYWVGLSPLTAGLKPIQTDITQASWQESFYKRDNAVPTAIISLPEDISDLDFEAAKESIKEQFGERRGSAITRAGDISVEVIQQTMEQLQLLEARRFNAEQIYQVFGVPKGLVTGDVSADNLYALQVLFTKYTIQPMLSDLAAYMTTSFRPYYEENFVVRAPNVVPQDRSIAIQEYMQYAQDRTINENRAVLGMEALSDEIAQTVPVRILRLLMGRYGWGNRAGTMTGFEAPERLVNRLSGDGQEENEEIENEPSAQGYHGSDDARALASAVRGELRRWQKVALREVDKGRNPAERLFQSVVIDGPTIDAIRAELDSVTDEVLVKEIFQRAIDTHVGFSQSAEDVMDKLSDDNDMEVDEA